MKLLVMLICSAVLLLILEKPIKKCTAVFYCAAMFLTLMGYVLQTKLPSGIIRTIVSDYLTSGTLPAALFVIVMYARVLPKKSRTFRCTMSLRGEIAILATIFGLTHIVYYGCFIGKRTGAMQGISFRELVTMAVAVLLILLLVPLTITSFKRIRRKMNGKRWKKLQSWSYLFYGLLYLHIAIALYPGAVSGDRGKMADLFCYTVIIGIYLALRVGKYLEKKNVLLCRQPLALLHSFPDGVSGLCLHAGKIRLLQPFTGKEIHITQTRRFEIFQEEKPWNRKE